MGLLVDAAEPSSIDVGVALGRLQRGVSQILLDKPQICPALQKMGGGTVAQVVGRGVGNSRARCQAMEVPPENALVQAGSSDADEKGRFRGGDGPPAQL